MSPRTDSNASTPTCFRFIEFLRTRVIFLPFLFSQRSPMVKRDDIFSMKRIELSFFPGKLIRIYYRPLSRYWKRNAYISVLFTFKPFRLIRIEKWKWVTNRRWIVIGRFLKNYPGISSTKRFEIRISFFSPIHLFLFLGPFHDVTRTWQLRYLRLRPSTPSNVSDALWGASFARVKFGAIGVASRHPGIPSSSSSRRLIRLINETMPRLWRL